MDSYEKHFDGCDLSQRVQWNVFHYTLGKWNFLFHVTIHSQLNDQNSIRYYIILFRVYTDPCEIGPPVLQLMIFVTVVCVYGGGGGGKTTKVQYGGEIYGSYLL